MLQQNPEVVLSPAVNVTKADDKEKARPKISIGVPVYNGEAYLRVALDSILAQTLQDFEVIISDNGSTDHTEEICREYAARDARISYHRQAENRGVSWNYNRTFELASGEYFQWLAYDDALMPDFLAKCIAMLDRTPGAVLCQSVVNVIDENGDTLGFYESGVSGTSPSEIFSRVVLKAHWCTELLGVIRSSALKQVSPYGHHHGSDEIMIAELSMLGAFLRVGEPLFLNREHRGRFSVSVSLDQHAAWFGAGKNEVLFPLWRVYRKYISTIHKYRISRVDRLRCYGTLCAWWFVNWNAIRMVVDILSAVDPRIFYVASRVKHRLFGSAAPMLRRRD
jgi:glycosyltransferase involved in cell wall biosynthesis